MYDSARGAGLKEWWKTNKCEKQLYTMAGNIISGETHYIHHLFELLPSSKCFRSNITYARINAYTHTHILNYTHIDINPYTHAYIYIWLMFPNRQIKDNFKIFASEKVKTLLTFLVCDTAVMVPFQPIVNFCTEVFILVNCLYLVILDVSVSLGWRIFPKVNAHIFGACCKLSHHLAKILKTVLLQYIWCILVYVTMWWILKYTSYWLLHHGLHLVSNPGINSRQFRRWITPMNNAYNITLINVIFT